MKRPAIALCAFVLGLATTATGMVRASDAAEAPAGPSTATLVALPDIEVPADLPEVGFDRVDWIERINARIARLGRDAGLPQSDRLGDAELGARIDEILNELPADARAAVAVTDLDTGRLLYGYAPERHLNPASNQKLLTASAAVELLGADYVFRTEVRREGDTLYLVGMGDPSLHPPDLYALASDVVGAGAHEGVRRIVVDDSAFDGVRYGPGYAGGEGSTYEAPSGALALDFSTVAIRIEPGDYDQAPRVSLVPESTAFELVVDARTGVGEPIGVETEEHAGRTRLHVTGAIPAGHAPMLVRRAVDDPGLVTGGNFALLLSRLSGDEPLPLERGVSAPEARLVATHESDPLHSVLGSALKYSNNFTSEQVLRTLAWRATGEPGSFEGGVETVQRYLEAIGVAADEFTFVNGSGLSRDGRASPKALVEVLARFRHGQDASLLLATLARGGGEGTMRNRVHFAGDRVRAKTGTMAGVSALSGVLGSDDGMRSIAFSILINGGQATQSRRIQDRIVATIDAEALAGE